MANNFDLSALALAAVCPGNEILYDDKGLPSIMVKIPKMTYAQLGLGAETTVHPAFIIDGVEKDAIWISKYQNIVVDGRAYSLPARDPGNSLTFDNAVTYCSAKGAGWHLMTKQEWALLALWCKNNGTLPYGNNNYGKDGRESGYKAIPTYYTGGQAGRVATGTGPLTWSHDRSPAGVWDLNGNVWEWNGGMRTVYGELQILADNNAANPANSQASSSAQWKAIDASTGSPIAPDGSGTTANSIKMDFIANKLTYSTTITDAAKGEHGCSFESVTYDGTISAAAVLVLQALGMLKYDSTSGAYEGDYFYFNNAQAELAFCSGGFWTSGAYAGVFFSNGSRSRGSSYTSVGFRAAFYE